MYHIVYKVTCRFAVYCYVLVGTNINVVPTFNDKFCRTSKLTRFLPVIFNVQFYLKFLPHTVIRVPVPTYRTYVYKDYLHLIVNESGLVASIRTSIEI